jgi:membrane protease YdiL (CAAX protease family)
MVMTILGFGSFMVLKFLPVVSPYTLTQMEKINENSPQQLVATALIVQGILSISMFLIPAWLFAYLAHPEPNEYIGLRRPGKKNQLLLSVLVMVGAMPLLQGMQNLIGQIDFGAKIKASQAASESVMNAYLNFPSFGAFLRGFVVLAIIPAIGEEMFFRGILLRFGKKRSRTMVFPIFITAVFFAYTHTNIYGFLSIASAGVLLAVIYNLTGSLWCSILAHMFFNGSQIILSYIGSNSVAVKEFLNSNSAPWYYVISGAVVFGVSFYLLLKNKTPLPGNWTDDFPPNEPQEGEWDFMQKNKQD